jgi:hypothetical protein
MTSRMLFYSFKIWMSAVIVAPFLLFVFFYLTDPEAMRAGSIKDMFQFTLFGMLFCVPSLLLFWVGSFYICYKAIFAGVKRLLLIFLALPLTYLPVMVICQCFAGRVVWEAVGIVGTCYLVAVMAWILIYRTPIIE